ncbi:MAG: hypothetical protein J0L97_03895 [Alphaproteobacteria bacterium]|nr:hypothetical protein [Alphaproteobacteria bacterium]
MDGYGYGFPFAWLHPYHDNDWGAYAIDPNEIAGTAIDYLNIALSLVLWAIAYFLAWRYFKRSSSNQAVSSGAKQ